MTTRSARLAKPLAVLAGVSALTAGAAGILPGKASATTPTPPVWETSTADPGAQGTLTFYDASGNIVTSGNIYDPTTLSSGSPDSVPLFSYAKASGTPTGFTGTKATLYFAMPDPNKTPAETWNTQGDSAGAFTFPDSSAPAPLNATSLPLAGPETSENDGADLPGALGALPPPSTTAGYANVIQVRMAVTAPGHLSTSQYWVSDLAYNTDTDTTDAPITVDGISVAPNTWEQVYFGPASSATTTTAVMTSAGSVDAGQQVTYTATVTPTPYAGAVQFSDGGTPISTCSNRPLTSGQATCTVSYATAGTHTISASYTGDAFSLGSSTTSSVTETVEAAATTTTVSATNNVPDDQPVTYTATISPTPDGGTVAFTDGGTTITGCGSAPVATTGASAGQATCTVPAYGAAGTHDIVATFSGTGNFATSTSDTWTETIQGAGTTTTVTGSPNPAVAGNSVTYTATVSPLPDGGTVAFSDGGNPITGCGSQTVSTTTGIATCTTTPDAGAHSIVAAYTGTANFADSTSSTYAENVSTATATTISPSASTVVTGQSVIYTATVSPTPDGGTVSFSDGTKTLCASATVSTTTGEATCQAAPSAAGTETVNATYSGDTLYQSSSTSTPASVTVNQAATSITLSTGQPSVPSGANVTYTAHVSATAPGSGTPTGSVTFTSTNGTSKTVALSGGTATATISFPAPGTFTVMASYAGDSNYTSSTSSAVTETVNQYSTSFSGPSSQTIAYGKTATLSTQLVGNGAGVGGVTVYLQDRPVTGGGWSTIGAYTTGGNGVVTATTPKLTVNEYFQWVFDGSGAYTASTSGTSVVTVDQALSTPAKSPSSIKHGKKVTIYGTVSPGKSGQIVYLYEKKVIKKTELIKRGSRKIKVKVSITEWVKVASTRLKVQKLPNHKKVLSYEFSIKLSTKGTYTFHVVAPATSSNLAGTSANVSVKAT